MHLYATQLSALPRVIVLSTNKDGFTTVQLDDWSKIYPDYYAAQKVVNPVLRPEWATEVLYNC